MATVAKYKLSGSTAGKPMLITSTNSTGANTIHTCGSATGENSHDEIYLWGFNNSTASVNLSIEYGDTTAVIVHTLTAKAGNTLVLPGTIGNASTAIKGFKSTTGTVGVVGFVNRISS